MLSHQCPNTKCPTPPHHRFHQISRPHWPPTLQAGTLPHLFISSMFCCGLSFIAASCNSECSCRHRHRHKHSHRHNHQHRHCHRHRHRTRHRQGHRHSDRRRRPIPEYKPIHTVPRTPLPPPPQQKPLLPLPSSPPPSPPPPPRLPGASIFFP